MRTFKVFITILILGVITACGAQLMNNPKLAYTALVDREACLVSHWPLSESGGIADDTKGPNDGQWILGTSTPGITFGVPGPFFGWQDVAAQFTAPALGSSDMTNSGEIVFPYNSTMQITGSLSIETWIMVPSANNNTLWNKVMWMGDNRATYGFGPWGFEIWGTQAPYIYMAFHVALDTNGDNTPRDVKAVSSTPFMDGNWHHMVGVYNASGTTDSDVIKFYIDGVATPVNYYLAGTLSSPGPLVGGKLNSNVYNTTTSSYGANGLGLVIGAGFNTAIASPYLQQWFDGTFSDMAFYNCALSRASVSAHYNQGKYGRH